MTKRKVEGVLPSNAWLKKYGHKGLIECMKKHPEMFEHIKQNKPKGKENK